jgi:hypothetical protein
VRVSDWPLQRNDHRGYFPSGEKIMNHKMIAAVAIGCLALEACSSRPREFTPQLATAAPDQAQFDSAYATCQQLLVSGKLDRNGRQGSAAAGVGAGAGTAAVGAATATAVGGWSGVALASATIVLLPFAVLGGAWGMSRMKRARKEHAIKTALQGCLHERGYEVAGWSKAARDKTPGTPPQGGN